MTRFRLFGLAATVSLVLVVSLVPAVQARQEPETPTRGDRPLLDGAPVAPREVVLTQPNGATFTATPWGDRALHGYETLDGYTVLRDNEGIFRFAARRGADGRLVASQRRPEQDEPPSGTEQHLRPSIETATTDDDGGGTPDPSMEASRS